MPREYTFHEAANIFPMIEGEAFTAFVEDIKSQGLIDPIELYDGQILDGRNRYTACKLADVDPRFVEVSPPDPVAYVLSKNLKRRQLNETQLGLVAHRSREYYEKAAKERKREGGRHGGEASGVVRSGGVKDKVSGPEPSWRNQSREEAGAAVGVSGATVDRVRAALKTATPELVKAMERGELKASTAKRIASLPADEQRAVLSGKSPAPPSQAKPAPRGSEGRPQIKAEASTAMEFAQMAISQLGRIRSDDPDRDKAFDRVTKWIDSQRS